MGKSSQVASTNNKGTGVSKEKESTIASMLDFAKSKLKSKGSSSKGGGKGKEVVEDGSPPQKRPKRAATKRRPNYADEEEQLEMAEGTIVPFEEQGPTLYPFGVPLHFEDAKTMAWCVKFNNFVVMSPFFPHFDTLSLFKLDTPVRSMLSSNNLGILLNDDPGSYHRLVVEFIASFECEMGEVGYGYRFGEKYEYALNWRFVLGGKHLELSRASFGELFGCNIEVYRENINERDRVGFWKSISGNDKFTPSEPSIAITDPLWKVLHRFVATCLGGRKDEARFVTKPDLDIMIIMNRKESILDVMTILTKRFLHYKGKNNRSKALCGGPFITSIARKFDFLLDHGTPVAKKLVDWNI